jgi:hypothetical protein
VTAKPPIVAALHLADVLDRENVALKAMDLRKATALLPEKTAAIADLAGSGAGPWLPDPTLLAVLRKLDELAQENHRLLERAIVAQQRVIGIVVRAASSAVPRSSYGAKGRLAPATGPMAFSARA